VLAHTFHAYNL